MPDRRTTAAFDIRGRVLGLGRLPEVVVACVKLAEAGGDFPGQRVHGDGRVTWHILHPRWFRSLWHCRCRYSLLKLCRKGVP